MDHPFSPSLTDINKCAKCKYDALTHTAMAVCECCPNIGVVEIFAGLAICASCIQKEMKTTLEHQSSDKQEARLAENKLLIQSQSIDAQIQVRTDIFNAQTIAIVELKKAIDDDDSITNKPYKLAEVLTERFLHFKKVIFDLGEQQIEYQNKQRAIHTYLNTLASSLRAEEREKLKIADVNYKPQPPKLTKSATPKRKTLDKHELADYANKLGVPMSVLQMTCVAKNMEPKEAYEHMASVMNGGVK